MKRTVRVLSAILAAIMIVASFVSCDDLLSNDFGSSSNSGDDTQSEITRIPSNENDTEDEEDGNEENESVESDANGESETKGESGTKGENETSEDTKGEETRFDYFSADLSEYVSVDESLYKGASVKLPAYLNGTDEAVKAYIQILLNNYAESTGNKIVDRAVKEGDTVALYYEGWLNGEKFAGGSNMDDSKPHMLKIGSGSFIPGFEEGLIGLVPNQTSRDNMYDLHITFPTDYHSKDLAGKAVIFKVYIEYIDEMAPAEYTAEFITKTLGYKTAESDVKSAFEKYLKEEYLPNMRKNEIVNAVWKDLITKAVITQYPQSEVDYFYNQYVKQYESYRAYYAQFGMTYATFDEFVIAYLGLGSGADWKKVTREQAETDVAQNLIFHAIAQSEKLTVTDEDYNNAIQYYIDYYASNGQTVTAAEIETNLGSRMIKEQALWDKVNEFITNNCTPTYE